MMFEIVYDDDGRLKPGHEYPISSPMSLGELKIKEKKGKKFDRARIRTHYLRVRKTCPLIH